MASKIYNPTTWVNGQQPAISAENLNKIEQGISGVDDRVIELDSNIADLESAVDAFADKIGETNERLPLKVRLSISGTATPGTFEKIVTAFSKGAVVYGYTSLSADVLYTLTSVDLPSTPLDYDVGTLTFTNAVADVGRLNRIQLTYFGEDETWSYTSYDVADKMTSQEAADLLNIAKGGS